MSVSGNLTLGYDPVFHGYCIGRVDLLVEFHEVDVPLPPERFVTVCFFHSSSFVLPDLSVLISTDVQRRKVHAQISRHRRTLSSGHIRPWRRDPKRDSSPLLAELNWCWLVTCAIAP